MSQATTAKVEAGHLFTFDAVAHIYRLDGVIIPGVSDCLEEAGLKHQWHGFQEAQWRGLHVHNACELLDYNDLDFNSVHEGWLGYVRAYERFKQDTGFVPELIETQMYHPFFRFGGTCDRFGRIDGQRVQIEIKTGGEEDWHRWQTAGYNLLAGEPWLTAERHNLYLQEDGTYRLVERTDASDFPTFLAAVTITHAKRRMQR